jgi:hypothetical protein
MFHGLTFFGIPLEIILRGSEIITVGCLIFGIGGTWYILSSPPKTRPLCIAEECIHNNDGDCTIKEIDSSGINECSEYKCS